MEVREILLALETLTVEQRAQVRARLVALDGGSSGDPEPQFIASDEATGIASDLMERFPDQLTRLAKA